MPFKLLNVVERNKSPLVEQLQPIVFEFGVTWFPANINMAAEELETAEFDWSFDNTSQLINLYETFPRVVRD